MLTTLPFAFNFAAGRGRHRPAQELRIDVKLQPEELERELDALQQRLQRSGDLLHELPILPFGPPDLVLRHREADGELYVYVEDIARQCLAGYTVFNRLIELDRRADRHLRAPHSRYRPAYQRRGLASAIYRWGLERGLCLLSGARQSEAARALWLALAGRYEAGYVLLRDKRLRYLGPEIAPAQREDLHTRMLLLGPDWSLPRLTRQVGLELGD